MQPRSLSMAASSSSTTLHITRQNFLNQAAKNHCPFSNSVTFSSKQRRLTSLIRSSGDASAETAAAEVEETESSIEVPKGPPSLISALNVERALRGLPITDADHYGRLGVTRGCSDEQVTAGYEYKVNELLNQGLDEEELSRKMELLRESYAILTSAEDRRLYDWSLARSDNPERFTWPFEVDRDEPSPEIPPAQEPEDVGPTRLVGYGFVAWLVLSVVMSFALSR